MQWVSSMETSYIGVLRGKKQMFVNAGSHNKVCLTVFIYIIFVFTVTVTSHQRLCDPHFLVLSPHFDDAYHVTVLV